jgi:hypothetical protein
MVCTFSALPSRHDPPNITLYRIELLLLVSDFQRCYTQTILYLARQFRVSGTCIQRLEYNSGDQERGNVTSRSEDKAMKMRSRSPEIWFEKKG